MKTSLLNTVLFCLLLGFVSIQAQERTVVKAHMMLSSKTIYDDYMEIYDNDENKTWSEMMNRVILNDMLLKRALQTTDESFSSESQWVYFGPSMINVIEDDRDQATSQIYTACMQPGQPLYEDIQSLKSAYYMQNINPYIMTRTINYVSRGEDIMIRNETTNFGQTYCGGFLGMVMPAEGDHTLAPLSGSKFTDPNGKVHNIGNIGWTCRNQEKLLPSKVKLGPSRTSIKRRTRWIPLRRLSAMMNTIS
jgi:hypothetical protein